MSCDVCVVTLSNSRRLTPAFSIPLSPVDTNLVATTSVSNIAHQAPQLPFFPSPWAPRRCILVPWAVSLQQGVARVSYFAIGGLWRSANGVEQRTIFNLLCNLTPQGTPLPPTIDLTLRGLLIPATVLDPTYLSAPYHHLAPPTLRLPSRSCYILLLEFLTPSKY